MHISPKISIIIPVYNTELYIAQAVNSILEQTLSDIEIIIINDGSTDNSLNVINNLAQKDKRIKVFTQNNQGQAAARNYGLNYATGEYIYFMDSDDILTFNALECCYKKCQSEDLDFVFFNADSFTQDNIHISTLDYHRTEKLIDKTYEGTEILYLQLERYEFKAPVWLNLISRKYLDKNQIRFNSSTSPHEDQLFSFYLYLHAEKVGFIPQAFFKRRLREHSVMTSQYSWKNISKYIIIAEELIDYRSKTSKELKTIIDIFLTQMMNAAIWNAYILKIQERISLFIVCKRKYSRYVSNNTLIKLLIKKHLKKQLER